MSFRLAEGHGQSASSLAVADELHEIGDAALLAREGDTFFLDLPWDVSQQSLHVLFDAGQDGREYLRFRNSLAQCHDDASLDELPRHEQSVGAGALRAAEAAVVTAALPADQSHGCAATPASQHPGEEMWWMRFDVAPLLLFEAACLANDRPASIDLHPSGADAFPDVMRKDSQRLVLNDVPLVVRLGNPALPTRAWVAARLSTVPGPPADVLLVLQNSADGGRGPTETRSTATRDTLFIQLPHDRRERLARREVEKYPTDHFGLGRVGHHPVSIRARPSPSIDTHLADGLRAVSVGCLPNAEAACLLAELPAERLLAEIIKVELIDDAPHLEAQLGVPVFAVEAISARDDPDAVEA